MKKKGTKYRNLYTGCNFLGIQKRQRFDVYVRAKQKYDEIVRKHEEGVQPLYRSKEWNYHERTKNKREKRKNWFRNDGSEAVFFLDATPNEELANMCKEVFKSQGLKVKVIERTGTTIKKTLVKSNPFKKNGCHQTTCKICSTGSEINCKTRETVYKISCEGVDENNEPCQDIHYIGETSRSIGERFKEHVGLVESKNDKVRKTSFFYDHIREKHNSENPLIGVEILARCPFNASLRQTLEAVTIREEDPILNRKQEWTNEPRKRKKNRDKQKIKKDNGRSVGMTSNK